MAETQPWDRQEYETSVSWAAFKVYRDLGLDRTLAAVLPIIGKKPVYKRQLETYSSKYRWVERCRAYDDYCDRRERAANEAEKRQAYKAKLDKYWEDKEKIARADYNIIAQGKRFVQQQLTFYLQNPAPARVGEVSALLRSLISLHEYADTTMLKILEHEAEGQQAVESQSIMIDSDDPTELIKEHQRLLDELSTDTKY